MRNSKSFPTPIRGSNITSNTSSNSTNTPTINRLSRLTTIEYSKLESKVKQEIVSRYRATDAGSLGVLLGVEQVLRIVREGWKYDE